MQIKSRQNARFVRGRGGIEGKKILMNSCHVRLEEYEREYEYENENENGNEYEYEDNAKKRPYRHTAEYKRWSQELGQDNLENIRKLKKTLTPGKQIDQDGLNNSDLAIKRHKTRKWVQQLRNKINFPRVEERTAAKIELQAQVSGRKNEKKSAKKDCHILKNIPLRANQSMVQEILNDLDEFEIKYTERLNARAFAK